MAARNRPKSKDRTRTPRARPVFPRVFANALDGKGVSRFPGQATALALEGSGASSAAPEAGAESGVATTAGT